MHNIVRYHLPKTYYKIYREKYAIFSNGKIFSLKNHKFLKPFRNKKGYMIVTLCGVDKQVHQIVLEVFDRKKKRNEVCRHLDGNPENNRLNNLKWGTNQENMNDMIRHLRSRRGEKHRCATLKDDQVKLIRKEFDSTTFSKNKFIVLTASKYNTTPNVIRDIIYNICWKHLPKSSIEIKPKRTKEETALLEQRVVQLYIERKTYREIKALTGCDTKTARNICKNIPILKPKGQYIILDANYMLYKSGKVYSIKNNRWITLQKNSNNEFCVNLTINNKRTTRSIKNLLWEYF